jgi:hypothetical protein
MADQRGEVGAIALAHDCTLRITGQGGYRLAWVLDGWSCRAASISPHRFFTGQR